MVLHGRLDCGDDGPLRANPHQQDPVDALVGPGAEAPPQDLDPGCGPPGLPLLRVGARAEPGARALGHPAGRPRLPCRNSARAPAAPEGDEAFAYTLLDHGPRLPRGDLGYLRRARRVPGRPTLGHPEPLHAHRIPTAHSHPKAVRYQRGHQFRSHQYLQRDERHRKNVPKEPHRGGEFVDRALCPLVRRDRAARTLRREQRPLVSAASARGAPADRVHDRRGLGGRSRRGVRRQRVVHDLAAAQDVRPHGGGGAVYRS
mmetsp:Transcript_21756/g.49198  ORF Transcript_21756/g.49198 Transcript_21756/m.49198 type:complete len:259 (-) Transcript_21756:391-1167(-)